MGGEASFDVVVIGSGFGGLTAGIEALRAGATVGIVEKRRHTGGNSRISDAVVAAAGSVEQQRAGIHDSPELLVDDMLAAGLGHNDVMWARLVAEGSSDAFRWLVDDIGCAFHPTIHRFGGHSRARCLEAVGSGKALVRTLEQRFRELGGDVLLRTAVTGFDHDAHGRVSRIGVEIDDGGARRVGLIVATAGVVVATGGFAGDVQLRRRHDERLGTEVATTNIPGTTGEVLQFLVELGAQTTGLEWIQLGPWTSPDERGYGLAPLFTSFVAFPYGIIIDPATGRRYVNELGDRRVQADLMLERGGPSLAIAGAAAVEKSGRSIDLALRTGCVAQFESLEAIASHHGIDPLVLAESVASFNEAITAGHDRGFEKPILAGTPLLTAPFFAARLWPKTHFTMGGLVIDGSARVIGRSGDPIPGVWAVGEVTGGTHGACRLSSMAIPECVVQGRIAAASIAQSA